MADVSFRSTDTISNNDLSMDVINTSISVHHIDDLPGVEWRCQYFNLKFVPNFNDQTTFDQKPA